MLAENAMDMKSFIPSSGEINRGTSARDREGLIAPKTYPNIYFKYTVHIRLLILWLIVDVSRCRKSSGFRVYFCETWLRCLVSVGFRE